MMAMRNPHHFFGALITVLMVMAGTRLVLASQATMFPTSGHDAEALASQASLLNGSNLSFVLNPSDDTFVDNFFPNKGFGDLPVMIVQYTPSVPESINIAYLKFDLPGHLPRQLVMTGARPANATLSLFVRLITFFFDATMAVQRVESSDWNENTLTWLTRPAFDPNDYAPDGSNVRRITANGTWVRWNVANAVALSMKEVRPIALGVIADQLAWRNYVWFDSKEHIRTKTIPFLTLDFVEPFLTLETPFSGLPITVGNQTFTTDASGRIQTRLPWGFYTVSVPEIIPKGEGVRSVFVGWSDNVTQATRTITLGENTTLRANFRTQYRLDVFSPYASTKGSGWYFENTNATISITPTAVPADGLLGFLGVRFVFDHWTGSCAGTRPECLFLMDSPRTATAVWREDYAITILGIAAVAAAICIIAFVLRRRRA